MNRKLKCTLAGLAATIPIWALLIVLLAVSETWIVGLFHFFGVFLVLVGFLGLGGLFVWGCETLRQCWEEKQGRDL